MHSQVNTVWALDTYLNRALEGQHFTTFMNNNYIVLHKYVGGIPHIGSGPQKYFFYIKI